MKSSSQLRFAVFGPPAPAVRMTGRGKFVRDHPKRAAMDRYLAFKAAVGWAAKEAGAVPVDGPVRVTVVVMLNAPEKRRWDVSNVLKACEDGLNAIAYRDDQQVVFASIEVVSVGGVPGGEGTVISVEPWAIEDQDDILALLSGQDDERPWA